MVRFKLVKLTYGDRWPKYAWYDIWSFRGDMQANLKNYCQNSVGEYADPERFKRNFALAQAGSTVDDGEYAAIILEEDPEVNEFGLVSP